MARNWTESKLQNFIASEIEESLTLEYKAAEALDRSETKKKEMTKDVSAMANSAGGVIVYGIAEYADAEKRHLPERITPVDRRRFPREWVEQIIQAIRPRIDGILIHSVNLASGENDVAFVIEIPQSNTAHQASDQRYYKRFNFQAVPMEDYEIRASDHQKYECENYIDYCNQNIIDKQSSKAISQSSVFVHKSTAKLF